MILKQEEEEEMMLKQEEEAATSAYEQYATSEEEFIEYEEETRKKPKQKFTPITPDEHEEWFDDMVYTLKQLSSVSIQKSYQFKS